MDEDYASLYDNEQSTGRIFSFFSGLAVFIACLGLFGLVSFAAARRTKEIGIRKVLGASIPGLLGLLLRYFAGSMGLANLLAWPAGYYLMNKWLQNFAYRIDLSLGTFILSGLVALGIALFTVGYQALKVVLASPVSSLRYE